MNIKQAWAHPNVRAFLRVIRDGESSQTDDAYRMLFGGSLIDDLSAHPNRAVSAAGHVSTAAGAYQFLSKTWNECKSALGLQDFSPQSQDLAAVYLISRRGALEDVQEGRIEEAIQKCNKEWASLPNSPYGQPVMTMQRALATYQQWLDDTHEPEEDPAPEQPQVNKPEKPKMALPAILAALLPSLVESIPKLSKIFGPKSEVAERNVKVAELAFQTVQQAVGAVNAQEAVDKIRSDPAAQQAAQKAIEVAWLELSEAGGDGITGARRAAMEYAQPDGPRFWLNPAFWISILLLLMPMMLLVDVFFIHPESYVGEIRTQIVTGVLLTIGIVGGYWLGTSFSSQRKTDLLAK